ncbi:MAG: RluA family pseudouridine synthase [Verrucomicrobia bacterium]|nr:RluA family pseudouridine synthase [Verrucomicrobiota bacterium]MBS0635918.1 RluA family pseudouridine synthase [Verrucomicrobiota bacterium]
MSIFVDPSESNLRLDKLLSIRFDTLSRTYLQWLISEGYVSLNGAIVKKSAKLQEGDEIEVQFVPTQELDLVPEDIPLDILYEDEYMIAVNKPAGLVVHPGPGNWKGTFVNALLFHCKTLEKTDDIRPGIVHRLDKETSGVLIAAKTHQMHGLLSNLFSSRKVEKRYLAICLGCPKQTTIDAPIGRHPTQRKLMTVVETGKPARTHINVIDTNGTLSLLDILLETGRTHQIRVHLKHILHPILGDEVYGKKLYGATRQLLHAASLTFCHPITGKDLVLNAPVPQDMAHFIEIIKYESRNTARSESKGDS